MKKGKLLVAILLFTLFCSILPMAVLAIQTVEVIEFDGTGMIGKYQLLTPTIENNNDYYVYNSQWYLLEDNQQESVNFGSKVPGRWYRYRLTLVVNDPNAYANECYIRINGVDWREEWGTTNDVIDGKRALVFEGLYHAHKGEKVKGVEPTCTQGGTKDYYLCGCGFHSFDEDGLVFIGSLDNVTLPPVAHEKNTLPYVSEVKATCESDGVIGHWHCPYCNNDFDFNDGDKNVSGKTVAPALGHKDGDNDGKCDACGKVLQTVTTTAPTETTAAPNETTAPQPGTDNTQSPDTVRTVAPETTAAPDKPAQPAQPAQVGLSVSTVVVIAVVAMMAGAVISLGTVLIVKKMK